MSARPWLLVAGDFSPRGGMDRANLELARHLAVTRPGPVHLVGHRIDESLRSLPTVVPHVVRRPAGRHALGALLLRRVGRRLARDLAPDRPLVISNGGNCPMPGTNWVHYVQTCCRNRSTGSPLLYRLRRFLNRRSNIKRELSAFRQSDLLIANSQKTRRDLIDACGVPADRIRVVYLGVDSGEFPPVSAAERAAVRGEWGFGGQDRVSLFVGVLGYDRNKGLDTLLAAFRRLPPEHRLLAVGSGNLDHWQRLADDAGVGGRVRFLGAREDVTRLLAAADVLVSPTRYDSYGLTVQEALCRGVPAIVSRAAGVAERYPDSLRELVLEDPEDAVTLAAMIDRTIAARSRLQPDLDALGAELRRWTWADMATAIASHVEEAA